MKIAKEKLVHQHVSQKIRDLIVAIDKLIAEYPMWTQGKRQACRLMKIGRDLKFVKGRMLDGKLDGLNYGTMAQRVLKFHPDLMAVLHALHGLYKRISAE